MTGEGRAPNALHGLQVHLTHWPTQKPVARILWEQVAFPLLLSRDRYDLCHAQAFVLPVLNRTPSVVTVYDLSFELYPEHFRAANRMYLQWGTRRSVAQARRVIAISESTKRDLMRLYGVPESQIAVIPPGIEQEFHREYKPEAVEQFRSRKSLPEHFILFVGTLEPRKNIPALVRAFMQARRRFKLPHRLVVVGGRGWMDKAITRAVQESGAQEWIIFPGFVPGDELPYWYRAADAFVYPSVYEGFGMPPLEAMAAGTPTVVADSSSLPEAVGDAALLVAPNDEASLEEALGQILTDDELRAELAARGRARARTFTWERAAAATAEVYRNVLHPPMES